MKILAIESAQSTVSVAAAEEDAAGVRRVLGEYTVNGTKDHSQTLLPAVDLLTERLGLELSELDAVAVSGGPGSFTGLR
ncbi:MAG: tRNA (adenosine(37)-N6)-threonylcarbamoyltransferase complex dimerization subunit type 1 TsaB, partial [Lachnospiraceae bacterium]|nr:tRNA (adenosine(37)-N6)-threonylcarbamoyltransferase complex dimerization subunit type 1 TsaB [Lachnospiraceae bacterium]